MFVSSISLTSFQSQFLACSSFDVHGADSINSVVRDLYGRCLRVEPISLEVGAEEEFSKFSVFGSECSVLDGKLVCHANLQKSKEDLCAVLC